MITFQAISAPSVYASNQTQSDRTIPDDKNRNEKVDGGPKSNEKVLGDPVTYHFVAAWGSAGSGDGQFSAPKGVAADSSGNVYVVDSGNNRIQKFDSNGNFISQFGTISGLIGIAIDSSGNIYVTDGYNVIKYGPNEATWNTTDQAYYLAVDSSGNVYVPEWSPLGRAFIEKFDPNGKLITQWGSYGTGNGQFGGVDGIAIDSSENVYVGDSNYRVQKFDSNGTYISQWGSRDGNCCYPGNFCEVHDVAADASGNVFVLDVDWGGCQRIQMFDSNGNFITQFGSMGSGDGQFCRFPQGLAADFSGNVYVADTDNSRIVKFGPNVPVGIKETKKESVKVSPNPASNIATVQLPEGANSEVKVVISNSMGQEVKEAIIPKGETKAELDLSDLNNGVYIYSFILNDKAVTGRIVVQK